MRDLGLVFRTIKLVRKVFKVEPATSSNQSINGISLLSVKQLRVALLRQHGCKAAANVLLGVRRDGIPPKVYSQHRFAQRP